MIPAEESFSEDEDEELDTPRPDRADDLHDPGPPGKQEPESSDRGPLGTQEPKPVYDDSSEAESEEEEEEAEHIPSPHPPESEEDWAQT